MQVINAVTASAQQFASFFDEGPEDGAFGMLNLLRFKAKAEYADGSDPDLTGAEAYARYAQAVMRMINDVGGRVVYGGPITGLKLGEVEDLWDAMVLVEYPSMAAFRAMLSCPEYATITHHRTAGLAGQINMRTKQGGGLQ